MQEQQTLEGYRLSPQQRRLWLLRSDSSPSAFRTRLLLRVGGRLDAARLRRALAAVTARHEILRTAFEALPGMTTPLQVISAEPAWQFDEIDLGGLEQSERRALADAEYEAAGEPDFEYAQGRLGRALLLRLGAEEHELLLSMSALWGDATGAVNLARELVEEYAGVGRPDSEGDEWLQYIIASEWQNKLLEEEETASGRDYWRGGWRAAATTQSAGGALVKSDTGATFDPRALELELPAALAQAVAGLARSLEVPRHVVLFTAWQALLWRLTGADPVVVGACFDGRSYEGMGEALGLFARYLPLAAGLGSGLSFAEAARRNAELWDEAAEWQEYFSWEQARGGEGEALFCRYGFEREELPEPWTADNLSLSVERVDSYADRFELRLGCRERGESLGLRLDYDAGVSGEAQARRMAERLLVLLDDATRRPDEEVARLSAIGAGERQQLLAEFNDTSAAYEPECLHRLFERQVRQTPDVVALTFQNEELTYAELDARANRLARHLQSLGVGPDVLVGVLLERSVEMVVSLLAVLKAGGAYVPLDPGYPAGRVRFMLEDSGARVLLTQSRLRESGAETAAEVVCVDAEWGQINDAYEADAPHTEVLPENLAYVIYTSGSTGRPKGAMVTHAAITNHMRWMQRRYPLTESDRVLQKTPFSFDASVWEFYAPLVAGARLVVAPPEAHRDPPLLARLMREEGVTILQVVPTLLRLLLSGGELGLCTALRRVYCGGEPLTGELRDLFAAQLPGAELVNLYGPTETTIDATHWCCEPGETWAAVPIGRPVDNMRAYVLDGGLGLVPAGAAGELCLGGAGLGRGYVGRPALTAERFVPDPFNTQPGARLYRSGDLVRWAEGGVLEYVSRIDSQVKVRGHRVELGEVERSVRRLPGVAEAAVVGQTGEAGSIERLVCYVEAEQGAEFKVEELRRALLEELPDHMVPAAWVRVERMPLTPSGKIDRRALPAPETVRAEAEEEYVAPGGPAEEMLAAIWSEVLGVEHVGARDNFFALGGDSIRSIQVMALAKEKGLNFSIQQLFEFQTIRELAAQVGESQGPAAPEAIRTEPFGLISAQDRLALPEGVEDAYPLTSLQSGMLYHMEMRAPGEPPVYHNVNSFHVRARLNVEALRAAVQRVVDRHPVLRTAFEMTRYSEPLQLVYKSAQVEVVEGEDLTGLSPEEQQERINEFMRSEYARPFDLTRAPLVRFHVHRRTPETFQYSLTENHAISDGWSTTSMFAEIYRYYFAMLKGEPVVEEPLPAQTFRDFVYLERQASESAECRDYWTEKLRGVTPTKLPRLSGAHRLDAAPKKHKFIGLIFRAELYEGLKRLARLAEAPLKTVMLTVHLKTLSVVCGQPDVMTALATNGRPEVTDGDRVRGLFINMVPLRLTLRDGSWVELVRETFAAEREMLPFRRYPLAVIQKELNQQKLLETAFNFVHFHSLEDVVRSGDVELITKGTKDLADTSFTMNTSFTIGITSLTAPRLEMGLEYDGAELSDEQVRAIVDCYIEVMRAMGRDPHASHADFGAAHLLSEQEQALLEAPTEVEELSAGFDF